MLLITIPMRLPSAKIITVQLYCYQCMTHIPLTLCHRISTLCHSHCVNNEPVVLNSSLSIKIRRLEGREFKSLRRSHVQNVNIALTVLTGTVKIASNHPKNLTHHSSFHGLLLLLPWISRESHPQWLSNHANRPNDYLQIVQHNLNISLN